MKSLTVRLTLLGLFVAAGSVTAYLFWQGESRAGEEIGSARAFDAAALAAGRQILDMRAAQQSYVAAGQGDQFWLAKVAAAVPSVRDAVSSLRASSTTAQATTALDTAAATLQDFEQTDRKARDHVRAAQRLLASDLIFGNGLEQTGAMVGAVDAARMAEERAHDEALSGIRLRQQFALGAAAAAALLSMLLLVPRPRADEPPPLRTVTSVAPARIAPAPAPGPSPAAEAEGWSPARPAPAPAPASAAAERKIQPVAKPAPVPVKPPEPSIDLPGMAALCTDVARIVDTESLPKILAGAASVLNASGIVLWISDPDGRELSPIVTHGYDHSIVLRLGTIGREAENATAAAFRTGLVQTVKSDALSSGAIAAPLVTPAGAVGVMAAEMRSGGERLPATLAAATILAAQLAMLVGPPSPRAHAKAEANA
jgi:GAF domain